MKRSQKRLSLLFTLLLLISTVLTPISALADQNQIDDVDAEVEKADDGKSEQKAENKSEDKNTHSDKDGNIHINDSLQEGVSEQNKVQNEKKTEDKKVATTKERAPPVTVNVRVETHEKTLVPTTEITVDNFDLSPYGGPASTDSPRAIHAIIRALETVDGLDLTNKNDFDLGYGGNYIAGVDNLFEFDAGFYSGWMYYIDNAWVPVGVLEHRIKDGESIVLYYVVNYTDNTFSWFDSESYSTSTGKPVEVQLTGVNYDVVNPVEGATILVDEEEYKVNGENVLTDENGKISLVFDQPGTYRLSANRLNDDDERNVSRPYAIVEVTDAEPEEVENDTEPPVITVEGMKDGDTVTDDTVSFTVQAIDDVDGEVTPSVKVNGEEINDENGSYTAKLKDGRNEIVITASDKAGNKATKTYVITFEPEKDNAKEYDIEERIEKAANYILANGVSSEWEAIGLAQAGKTVPESYKEVFYNNVKSQIENTLPFNRTKITDIERLTIAAVAIGEDPRDIDGLNLIDLLYNSPMRGNSDTMTFQGNNGPIFALIALDTLNFPEPYDAKWTRQKLIQELLNNQNEDGSWALNPSFVLPSVDISAMAIIGLAPYKDQPEVDEAIQKVLGYLSSVQNDQGGFTESFVGGTSSEASSQAIIGLTAYGMDPTDEMFTKKGNNLIDHLLSYQNEDGGFAHLPGDRTNAMATEQALQALVAYDLFLKDKGRLYEFGSVDKLDKQIAEKVVNQINELPNVEEITLEDKDKVIQVRESFESLTNAQKEFVSNIHLLEQLEDKIIELEKQLEEEKAAIKAVEDKITKLPNKENVTLKDKTVVEEARQAYEKLTDSQKKLVSNLSKLVSVEKQIAALEKQLEQDKAKAKEIDEKINALPNVELVTLGDKESIDQVRKAYEKLTAVQKGFVKNLAKLEALEAKIKALEKQLEQDKAKAKEVDDKIDALPNVTSITLENKKSINKARQAYENLTATQKGFVKNLAKLEALEAKIKALEKQLEQDKAKAKEIDEQIAALPDVESVTLEDKESINQVRVAYDNLTPTQKGFVKNLAQLEKLEDKINQLSFVVEKTEEETTIITGYKGDDKDIVIPEKIDNLTVTKVAPYALSGKEIETVQLPNTLEEIGEGAFSDNKIKEVALPNTLQKVNKNAFANNEIKNVSISNSVKEIDESAFVNNKIEAIQIPKSVNKIGKSAFKNNRLTSVTFTAPAQFRTFSFMPMNVTTSEVVETVIEEEAFMNNNLTEIFIPEHIYTIGDRAFYNNYLENVSIANSLSLMNIGEDAFANNGMDGNTTISPTSITDVKVDLENAIEEASKIEEGKYTEESYRNLTEAIHLANSVLSNPFSTLDEINEASEGIKTAVEALKVKDTEEPKEPEVPTEPEVPEPTEPTPEDPPTPKPGTPGDDLGDQKGNNGSNKGKNGSLTLPVGNDHPSGKGTSTGNNDSKKSDTEEQLPRTATQMYNIMLIGVTLIVLACAILYIQKRRIVK